MCDFWRQSILFLSYKGKEVAAGSETLQSQDQTGIESLA